MHINVHEHDLYEFLYQIGRRFEFILNCSSDGECWNFKMLSRDGTEVVEEFRCRSIDDLCSQLDIMVKDIVNLNDEKEIEYLCDYDAGGD